MYQGYGGGGKVPVMMDPYVPGPLSPSSLLRPNLQGPIFRMPLHLGEHSTPENVQGKS